MSVTVWKRGDNYFSVNEALNAYMLLFILKITKRQITLCLSHIKKFFVSRNLLWQYFCHNHWVNQWICPPVNFAVWWIVRNLDPCLCFTMCRSNTRELWIRATFLPPLSDVIVRHVALTKTCPAKSFQWSILTWIKSSSEFITLNSSDIRILLV